MESLKTNCPLLGQPEFRICWTSPSIPIEDVEWLKGHLEERVRAGEIFKNGDSFQIGWMVARIREGEAGTLEFEEPTFDSMPIRWERTLDRSLRDLRRQKDVVESFQPILELAYPSMLQAAKVCKGHSRGGPVIIERGQPHQRFSGWFLTCAAEGHSHEPAALDLMSLYEAAMKRPDLVPYFALPPGCAGRIAQGDIELYRHDTKLTVRSGSYLGKLLERSCDR